MDLITHPVALAAAGGLLLALLVHFAGLKTRRDLRKEINALKDHLHRQKTINEKGYAAVIQENVVLAKKVNQLKSSLSALSSKPSRSELRALYLHEKGIQLMYLKVPGFAPHWEAFKKEADAEMEKILFGNLFWPRSRKRTSLSIGSSEPAAPAIQSRPDVEV